MSPLHGGVDRNPCVVIAANWFDESPLHGGVDRNDLDWSKTARLDRSPLHGGVDRNMPYAPTREEPVPSPLHGGVDRNKTESVDIKGADGRPFTGAWIETSSRPSSARSIRVAPSRGRGSKLPDRALNARETASPLHGGVDRNMASPNRPVNGCGRPLTGALPIANRSLGKCEPFCAIALYRRRKLPVPGLRQGRISWLKQPPERRGDRSPGGMNVRYRVEVAKKPRREVLNSILD